MRYTDIENTGMAVVPDLSGRTSERNALEETVWSHRLTPTLDDLE